MISADTNLFLYAYDTDSPRYAAAQAFFERHADNDGFCICGLMLVELYMQMRNKAVIASTATAAEAADYCEQLANHPVWSCVDYEPGLLPKLWTMARKNSFAFRRIIDARMALTLIHNGVTDFATANVKDFRDFGFRRVWNPLEE